MRANQLKPRQIFVVDESPELKEADAVVSPTSKRPYGFCGRVLSRIYLCVLCLACVVTCLTIYLTLTASMKKAVIETYELCSTSSATYDQYMNPPRQSKPFFVYNITNPYEFFVSGGDAEVYELGPYHLNDDRLKRNVEFKDNVMSYVPYSLFKFDPSKSCPWCQDINARIYTMHIGYSTLLVAGARSEASLLLAQACSPTQISLISSQDSSVEFCTLGELMTAASCRCCYTSAFVDGAVSCASLTSPTSLAAGRMSWLAKYEGGLKISDQVNPVGFPLASGIYTAISRETTPSELAFGTGSPLLGFFSFAPANDFSKSDIANVTRDIGSVCLPLSCPSLNELVDTISRIDEGSGYDYLKGVTCQGRIPNYSELVSNLGLSKERAAELRYLEGVNCRAYTPTLIIAALAANNSWLYTCHRNDDSAPCCMSMLMGPTGFRGPGFGCMSYFRGMLTKRRVFNVADALAFVRKPSARSTNCASTRSERLLVKMEDGETEFTRWITPSTYSFPNMQWADPLITQFAATSPSSNVSKINLGSQKFLGQSDPQRMKSSLFLVGEEITDEKPKKSNYIRNAFFPNALAERSLVYEKTSIFYGLQTLHYYNSPTNTTSDEFSQRRGELPYRNMQNLLYSNGFPVIVTLPNFHGVDSRIYRQNLTSNGLKGGGINMYRLIDGYSHDSKPFRTPMAINAESNRKYADSFIFKLSYAAITGSAVEGSIPVQLNTFTLNCNPYLDSSCSLKTVPVGAESKMCYVFTNSVEWHSPCSAFNVFTPRVRGERVLPVVWYNNGGRAPEEKLFPFKVLVWIVFASSVGIIAFSVCVVLLFFTWVYLNWRNQSPCSSPVVIVPTALGVDQESIWAVSATCATGMDHQL